ncbi:GreA/GreB family elongation factor [Paradesertivirga mongoliensis]|uniref:GreA/GreB family elongation factor n=1 Tax=Paradesertivirga mongoliensis TaxID=2100740 RepID=A0ABW4ZNT8_9SPHI|nr:GreA/GreB family elongation factor [Pedobacter mongoliensis]
MKRQQLILTKEDFAFLMECYFSRHLSEFNKAKLSQELRKAKIVKKEFLPTNVICTNSKVLVSNIDKGQTFNVHIIGSEAKGRNNNDIPITDPLAIALLGYASGVVVEWEMGDGVNRFEVISVYQEDNDAFPTLSIA